MPDSAQALSVKRAQVDFHNFASLGEPERALAAYADENMRRGSVLRSHLDFFPRGLSPFLEVGANAGHTSYLLVNDFAAEGFALDLSFDALRHGRFLTKAWNLSRSPVLVAGDALRLPFRDNSLRVVTAFQTLSQFTDVEAVIREVHRVLAPGGVFYFAEEPVRRKLTLRLYRVPYPERMTPWEKRLFGWGLLDFIARDVIGAYQEESFGIRQNHRFGMKEWAGLLGNYFDDSRLVTFSMQRGWANRAAQFAIRHIGLSYPETVLADLLGGTLAAFCRKAGEAPESLPLMDALACPDCGAPLRQAAGALRCSGCEFASVEEEGVYNLLSTAMRAELYPGPRADSVDFSKPDHERALIAGFHGLEGDFGNKYRWTDGAASVRLENIRGGAALLRVQGFAPQSLFAHGAPRVELRANGAPAGEWKLDRPGLFVLENPLAEAPEYTVEIRSTPTFLEDESTPHCTRRLGVILSVIRLLPGGEAQ